MKIKDRIFKFRGMSAYGQRRWVYGNLCGTDEHPRIEEVIPFEDKPHTYHLPMTEVYPESVGQFTGILDKDGNEIYEGDIIRYYDVCNICINPDCEPYNYIYENYLKEVEDVVSFKGGTFMSDESDCSLVYCACNDLDFVRESLNATKDNGFTDRDGNVVDESVIGIRVIGNIFEAKNEQRN